MQLQQKNAPKKMKTGKWLLLILVLIAAVIGFLPTMLSSSLGNRLFFYVVHHKTGISISSGQAQFSWLGPQQFENLTLRNHELRGIVKLLTLETTFWNFPNFFDLKKLNRATGTLKLAESSFQFSSHIEVENIEFSGKFSSGIVDFIAAGTSRQAAQAGSFSLKGEFSSPSRFSMQGSLVSFPSFPLDYFLSQYQLIEKNVFTQAFGNWINLNGSASLNDNQGSFDAALQSPNIACTLQGNLSENYLTLRQPLSATIQLTPELSRWLLSKMNPLFVNGIKANNPILLRIEADGFRSPLSNFSLKEIQIERGVVNLGQVRCRNGSSLTSILTILKKQSVAQEMNIWFSSMPFSLHNGILNTERMDALVADSIHICTWGKINLINEQLHLFLGLTASALKKAFHITNLPKDFVLEIPITGSIKEPLISTEGASAKIAALKASETIFKGSLPERIIKSFIPAEQNVPPARHPFPWE